MSSSDDFTPSELLVVLGGGVLELTVDRPHKRKAITTPLTQRQATGELDVSRCEEAIRRDSAMQTATSGRKVRP